ncbi:MAG: hypothetical protein SGARI_000010, partial [Bacillariaceae sp.]
MANDSVMTLQAIHDGGAYVHRSQHEREGVVIDVHIPNKRHTMPDKQAKPELSAYRKEMQASKVKSKRPGLLKKAAGAVSSMRSLLPDEADMEDDILNSPLAQMALRNRRRSNSFGALDRSDTDKVEEKQNKDLSDDGNGLARSSSNPLLARIDKDKPIKYKSVFKKAASLVSITSRMAASAGTSSTTNAQWPSQSPPQVDNKPVLGVMPVNFASVISNKTSTTRSVSSFSSDDSDVESSDSEEMTLKELKRFIFQCPDDMTLGDLKRFIKIKEGQTKHTNTINVPQLQLHAGSLSRSTSAGSSNRRSRSTSRPRRAQRRSSTDPVDSTTGNNNDNDAGEKRRNSMGRRKSPGPSLAAHSDHGAARRRRAAANEQLSVSNHSVHSES